MKLAFTSLYDINNIGYWSGTINNMYNGLVNSGMEIIDAGNAKIPYKPYYKIKNHLYKKILNSLYFIEREPFILKAYSMHFEKLMKSKEYDVIISAQTPELCYLESIKPLVFWVDATYQLILRQLEGRVKLNDKYSELGNRIDRQVFNKASILIFASDWAAESAVQDYKIDRKKIKVVPFGANIKNDFTYSDIKSFINQREGPIKKILFIAANWEQKGGAIVLDVVKILNDNGLKTELNIVGGKPGKWPLPYFAKYHGYLNKNNRNDYQKLIRLYTGSQLFFMPSRQEAYGLVFCEANSFGIPVIGTNMGGVPTIIKDGINGFTFDVNSSPEQYSVKIAEILSNPSYCSELSINSFNEFITRLNWDVSCNKVKELLGEIV